MKLRVLVLSGICFSLVGMEPPYQVRFSARSKSAVQAKAASKPLACTSVSLSTALGSVNSSQENYTEQDPLVCWDDEDTQHGPLEDSTPQYFCTPVQKPSTLGSKLKGVFAKIMPLKGPYIPPANGECYLLALPDVLLYKIFQRVSLVDLASFARTCKVSRDIIRDCFRNVSDFEKQRKIKKFGSFNFPSKITALKTSKDGKQIVAAGNDGTIIVWSSVLKKVVQSACPYRDYIEDLVINTKENLIFLCYFKGGFGRMSITTGSFNLLESQKGSSACALSGDENVLLTGGCRSGKLFVGDPVTGERKSGIQVVDTQAYTDIVTINRICVDKAGKIVLVLCGDYFAKNSLSVDLPYLMPFNHQDLYIGNLETAAWRLLLKNVGPECALYDENRYLYHLLKVYFNYSVGEGGGGLDGYAQSNFLMSSIGSLRYVLYDGTDRRRIKFTYAFTQDGKGLIVGAAGAFHFYHFSEIKGSFRKFLSYKPHYFNAWNTMAVSGDGGLIAIDYGGEVEVYTKEL